MQKMDLEDSDSQREFAIWLRKFKQRLSVNLERWDGVWEKLKAGAEGDDRG